MRQLIELLAIFFLLLMLLAVAYKLGYESGNKQPKYCPQCQCSQLQESNFKITYRNI
jgi:predicted Zn-ribbon and HTH transcriptional regulator